ncbi:MAG: hypothetical protein LH466_01225 [Sphingomonas bacterium]|nr:hypothetical protein [Sphingomonas bacterium]
MGEPKAFASLSSGLLARKGAARPAMRPQGFGQVGSGLEDLGWNDMGFEAPKPALTPVRDDQHDAFGEQLSEPALRNPLAALTPPALTAAASPVHDQQAEIADRFAHYTVESSDEEDVDETAELYDPAAEAAGGDEEEEDDDDRAVAAPVLATKPQRALAGPVAPIAISPLAIAPVASTPAPSAAVRQPAAHAPRPRAAAGGKAKAAFTLRLDAERHLKLRLACAVTGRSAQQLVTEALDQLLGSMPELNSMADRAPHQRANR